MAFSFHVKAVVLQNSSVISPRLNIYVMILATHTQCQYWVQLLGL